jgi:ubiquinone/menaquinone biosynthesis C-methylase UbiE
VGCESALIKSRVAYKIGTRGDLSMVREIDLQIAYWDRVAREKRFSHPVRRDWLAQYLKNPQAGILDYGCGYGRTLAELSQAGFQNLVGVDFSAVMLVRARAEVPHAELIRNDGHSLPFKSNSFDAVLLFAVLTCIPDGHEQRLLLAEVERVLRSGGLLYVSDVLINNDQRNRERYEQYAESYGCYGVFELPEGVVVRHHQREWIEKLTSPFQQLEYEPFTVTTMNGNASAAFQYLGGKS